MELMLRRQKASPQSKESPLGTVGTEWCIINKEWWDGWCKYAGGQGGAVRSPGGSPTSSPRLSQHSQPAMVDNWAIVTKQGGIMQVAQGLTVGKQVHVTSLHFTSLVSVLLSLYLFVSPYLSVSLSVSLSLCLSVFWIAVFSSISVFVFLKLMISPSFRYSSCLRFNIIVTSLFLLLPSNHHFLVSCKIVSSHPRL